MKNDNKNIVIKGARVNNLKNIDVEIPHNKFTVITGLSGSGKSSLAFNTLYAEGQRRFVESLSAYARQFLERMPKPDVDLITGIPPALAIEQKTPSNNPRSTVGTTTEIYDYLRLLFGRIGKTYCKNCGREVKKDNPDTVIDEIKKMNLDDKLYILFKPDETLDAKQNVLFLKQKGFFRVFNNNDKTILDFDEIENINEHFILVDRFKLKDDPDLFSRIRESLEIAFKNGNNKVIVYNATTDIMYKFSSNFECSYCEILYFEPEPKLFSFNNPFGACPHCQGFGRTIDIDENLVIPDKLRSIKRGAIHPFNTEIGAKYLRALLSISPKYDIDVNEPYMNLSEKQKQIIWEGADNYKGINGFFKMLEEKSYKMHYRILISRYRGYTTCKICGGSRIRTSARQVFINGMNIPKLIDLPLSKVYDFIANLELNDYEKEITSSIMKELKWRLSLLLDIGLHYLTLSRLTHTLSGGEAQRINLTTALGYSLVSTLYVLDEPSIGLHSIDTSRLLKIIYKLRDLGNTIVVIEHDPEIINNADYIIDMGPLAGDKGGEIVVRGKIDDIINNSHSLTGKYLSGQFKQEINYNENFRWKSSIILEKPIKYNLKIDKVEFPLNCICCVTGVSGSGKSTLVRDVLYKYLEKFYSGYSGFVGDFEKIDGLNYIDSVELVDQSPIGKSSRSTPVTYIKAFDAIREVFASTPTAKQLGLKPGYFSFNVPGGRCETCEGEGYISVDMQFLPDVTLICEDCNGTRYKKETQKITYKSKSIVDVLEMTVDEAIEFFKDEAKIIKKLKILQKVGLGYLKLGQPSNVLSGGEAQRLKLANHLDNNKQKNVLFIFDEPTTGLHFHDIKKLLGCLKELVNSGNSVLIIEHNLQIISFANWVIDLGPDAGESGGRIVDCGTPFKLSKNKTSYTGLALNKYFSILTKNQ